MGGAVSTGRDNDELIDNLLEADYIKSPLVERVFRAVDRANYFLTEARGSAYKDVAWKSGNLHVSAPCIYSEVMEGLKLEAGLSFLNLGSGTGYLSTMVGLILGPYGINHGIELQKDVVEYANEKLEGFKKYSHAMDEYEFCEPQFVQGNCLCLNSEVRQYDRVYCGAACPEPHENYMKNLIKVGGILVMPLNDRLLQFTRTSETNWDVKSLLPVSFATLISPSTTETQEMFKMLDSEPISLQAACRATIRTILRQNIEIDHPTIRNQIRCQPKRPRKKRTLRRFVLPIFEESGDESSESDIPSVNDLVGMHRLETGITEVGRGEVNTLLELMLSIGYRNSRVTMNNDDTNQDNEPPVNATSSVAESNDNFREANEESSPSKDIAIVTQYPLVSQDDSSSSDSDTESKSDNVTESVNNNSKSPKAVPKREKFDSGIGDEDVMHSKEHTDEDSDEEDHGMDVDTDSDSSVNVHDDRINKRSSPQDDGSSTRNGCKWKRIALSSKRITESESDSDAPQERSADSDNADEPLVYVSPYTKHMRTKIQALPLPTVLKNYINFNRGFNKYF